MARFATLFLFAAALATACGSPLFAQPIAQPKTQPIVQLPATPRARIPLPLYSGRGAYPATHALIIGINYEDRQKELKSDADRRALPKLLNAENDARGLKQVLTDYYGYEENHCTLLTGSDATYDGIETQISVLCDRNRVKPDDSVLIFFSGHGLRLDSRAANLGNAVALLPHDVQLADGRPIGKILRIPRQLAERLNEIPARHKLLILDCCFSGEIFNVSYERIGFQQRSDSDPRSDTQLQQLPAFQAMASCRATQVASDGLGGYSPFTAALLDGLKRLPARGGNDARVWANRLLWHIRPNFDEDQRPDCRSLIGSEGEFCFYPDPGVSFDQFRIAANEENLLKATVASRQGNWWFDEMPWFIPSIRDQIIKTYEQTRDVKRTSQLAELIEPGELKRSFEQMLRESAKTDLEKMRQRHARSLLRTHTTKDFKDELRNILNELTTSSLQMQATDYHLTAVIQHALGKAEEADLAYTRTIELYQDSIESEERPLLHILLALCHADRGELRHGELRNAELAAHSFQEAQRIIQSIAGSGAEGRGRQDSAVMFRIYALCREADAYLTINHWSKANDRLDLALNLARDFAPNHYLTAHVHRRRAWSEIIQWRIGEAERAFRRSNEILATRFRNEFGSSESGSEFSGAAAAPADLSEVELGGEPSPRAENPAEFRLPPAFHRSRDFPSKTAYLHNLHGVAMAVRFQGDSRSAAKRYRELAGMVEETITDFRETTVDQDVEQQLIGRLVNTQERLGDCNLFGDPDVRDLKEAVDDYRKALSRVHWLEPARRDKWSATLLYKQALALSLPSSIQDPELALEMCRRADQFYATEKETAKGLYLALGTLVSPTVKLAVLSSAPGGAENPASDVAGDDAAAELRQVVYEFRDAVGLHPHRDQLELCLFASQVLLEHDGKRSRFQTLEDADLLLSFCRIGLKPYRRDARTTNDGSESRSYLRPYYDSAMRGKMKASATHVKDLLEIQWEATKGTRYVKPGRNAPILATYILDDDCYLLFDLPRGKSRCVPLAEMYDAQTVRRACEGREQPLPLPHDVQESLTNWLQNAGTDESAGVIAYLLWHDPVRKLGTGSGARHSTARRSSQSGAPPTPEPFTGEFPFRLPPELGKSDRTVK